MLQLTHHYAAFPAAALLLLPPSLVLYPSADAVLVLDAHDLALRHVLPFWHAFPSTRHANHAISCMTVDAGMKLVCRIPLRRILLSLTRPDHRRHGLAHRSVVSVGQAEGFLARPLGPRSAGKLNRHHT